MWDSIEALPGYAPRPTPGTILDLDLILQKCDFSNNKVSNLHRPADGVVRPRLLGVSADRRAAGQWATGAPRKLSRKLQTALL